MKVRRGQKGQSQTLGAEEFEGPTETSRRVRVRLAQRFFRKSVLASYNGQCGVSGINLSPLLIASHILAWSRFPEHRADPRNGICLSRLHDAAFDRGLIAFDESYRLILSKALHDAISNSVLNEAFKRFEGKALRLPDKFRPGMSFLAIHREDVFLG